MCCRVNNVNSSSPCFTQLCNMPVYQFELCNAPDYEIIQVNNQTALSYTDAILRDTDYKLAEADEAHVVEYAIMVFCIIVSLFLLMVLVNCTMTCYLCNRFKCCLKCNNLSSRNNNKTTFYASEPDLRSNLGPQRVEDWHHL